MKKRAALKRYVYKTPLTGGKLIMLGALIMFLWAIWECAVRIDAMDGMTKAYFNLVKDANIPIKDAVRTIWETPEARADWLNIVHLGSIAVFSAFAFLFSRRWAPGFLVIPACVCVMFFHTSDSMIIRTLNLFETLKLGCAGAVIAGEGLNIACAVTRRRAYKKRLNARKKAQKSISGRNSKTLIPAKKYPRTGVGM